MANLFMTKQEEDVIYRERRPELVLWKKYIEDVLFLWEADFDSLKNFMEFMNTNDRGICLKHEASRNEIHFKQWRLLQVKQ